MSRARSDDLHRQLVDRVVRRVEGHGVSRAAVDAAVTSVLAALDRGAPASDAPRPAPASSEVVAAVTAHSMPDLASRLRAALEREGVSVGRIGIAAAGAHHVATLSIPAASRQRLEAAAGTLGAAVSVVSEADGR